MSGPTSKFTLRWSLPLSIARSDLRQVRMLNKKLETGETLNKCGLFPGEKPLLSKENMAAQLSLAKLPLNKPQDYI